MVASLKRLLAGVVVLGAVAYGALLARSSSPPLPTLLPEGGLSYECRDAAVDALIPCKLTLVGVDKTPRPALTHGDIGRQEGDAIAAHDRIMSLSGRGVAHVPVGTYDVYVSRGPEWDLFIARHVHVTPKGAVVRASLRHVVDTTGWISADFHVHAALSSDSHVPMHDRVYEFASDGVEVIVSTDHNVVADYEPIIQELGAGRFLASISGDELTTNGWGHFGGWPLPHELERSGQGAVHVYGRDAKGFFQDIRKASPEAVINIHHPRLDQEIGYFNLGRLNSHTDRAERPGFSFDFDAVEVLNGYQDCERRSVDRMIDDWFALLEHGHLVTATGNSDTHHLDHNIGGYPRNYVRVQDDAPQKLRPYELPRAVKARRVLFTTAPFVRLWVGKGEIGDLVAATSRHARAEFEVQAAPWVSVSRVTMYLNGEEVRRWAVPESSQIVRIRDGMELQLTRDSHVVVRVDGERPLSPVVGDMRHFDVLPFALTNPVFLDVDGNGAYDPPQKHGRH